MAGELRLVWWREALTRRARRGGAGPPDRRRARSTRCEKFRPPAHLIENAVTARQFDLYDDAFPNVVESGGLSRRDALGALADRGVCAGGRPRRRRRRRRAVLPASRSGLIELMRGLSRPARADRLRSARHSRAPAQLRRICAPGAPRRRSPRRLRDLAALARRRLGEAEAALAKLPKALAPAYAGLATAPLWLAAIERAAREIFERPIEVAAWRRQWALWRWSRRT